MGSISRKSNHTAVKRTVTAAMKSLKQVNSATKVDDAYTIQDTCYPQTETAGRTHVGLVC